MAGHAGNVAVEAFLAGGCILRPVEERRMGAVERAQFPRRRTLRSVGRHKSHAKQCELNADVLANVIAQLSGYVPGLGASVRVSAVVKGKPQPPGTHRPFETVIGQFVKHPGQVEATPARDGTGSV